MTHRVYITPLLATLCLFVAAATAEGQVLYIDVNNTSGVEDGLSWATAYKSIRRALAEGPPATEGWVKSGIYREYNLNATGLYGGFAGTETSRDQRDWVANPTIIDGSIGAETETGSWNVIKTQFIDGFTIRGASGLGIVSTGPGCVVRNCIIENNQSRGVDLGQDGAMLQNCVIRNNGNIGVIAGRNVLIEDCVFDGNRLRLEGSPLGSPGFVRRCVFRDIGMMAIEEVGLPYVVENCLFVNNAIAIRADGIRDEYDDVYYSSRLWLFNNTFADNGKALVQQNMYSIQVQNCIFARSNGVFLSGYSNHLSILASLFEDGLEEPSFDGYSAQSLMLENVMDGKPQFVAPALGDYRLRPTSSAIDVGSNDLLMLPPNSAYASFIDYPTDDLVHSPRPLGDHYDLGTYEFDPDATFTDPYDPSGDGQTNAIDIQRVINAILASGVADINGDDNTDATDIQLIINAALGIG